MKLSKAVKNYNMYSGEKMQNYMSILIHSTCSTKDYLQILLKHDSSQEPFTVSCEL